MQQQQAHRAGALKQSNKSHKSGKHRSKGSIDAAMKGRVNVSVLTKRNKLLLNKEERKHQALQLRRIKREEVLIQKRGLGGSNTAPFLTCVVPLNVQLDTKMAIDMFKSSNDNVVTTVSPGGVTHISLSLFKQRYSFICPEVENEFETLDALKVADSVLFLVSALDEPIDEWGKKILTAAIGQGLPSPIVGLMDIESLNPKKRTQEKQNIQKLISKWLPEEKIFQLDKNSDALNLFRRIGSMKRRFLHHRERRPYLLAEQYEYTPNAEGDLGVLKVSGYLRGVSLSVNGLVHIPSLGDYQMSHIYAPSDPHPLEKVRNGETHDVQMSNSEVKLLEMCDPAKQESLASENEPDPMDGEQTWPNAEEIKQAQEETKQQKRNIPKGMSDYQATWIGESDEEDVSDVSEDESDGKFMSCDEDVSGGEEDMDKVEYESVADSEVGLSDEKYDQSMSAVEEMEMLEKIKAARSDQIFPDEVDTPDNVPALERFQKYRGLESFRTSPWDPKENLPLDYARIFQFKNFDQTRKRILKETDDRDGALPGWYITLRIPNVAKAVWESYTDYKNITPRGAMVVFGLLPHEHKMSIVNVVLKRTGISDDPIKCKERLLMQCGYRRYIVSPIFSQHTNGQKHKYERFFQPGSTSVATFFAPIQFNPSSVLCYKARGSSTQLIATGCLLSCNPDRIIIKRIVLSGHPFKVNKKSAVIRFMFFNRDDVLYFKPCKLRTKYGRTGHIKESLGTHGHMKCVFDSQLKSQDTVLLNLYKRVFPKWTYDDCVLNTDDLPAKSDDMQD